MSRRFFDTLEKGGPDAKACFDEAQAALRQELRKRGACDAEERAADILSLAWENRGKVERADRPDAYAVAIEAHRTIHAALRESLCLDAVPADSPLLSDGRALSPEDRALTKKAVKCFLRVLRRVEPRTRRLVELRLADDLSFAEIGEQLGLSQYQARDQYHAAIDAIFGLLKRERECYDTFAELFDRKHLR